MQLVVDFTSWVTPAIGITTDTTSKFEIQIAFLCVWLIIRIG